MAREGEIMKITIEERKDGGYFILADGRYIESRSEGTEPNYRYLHGVEGTVTTRHLVSFLTGGRWRVKPPSS